MPVSPREGVGTGVWVALHFQVWNVHFIGTGCRVWNYAWESIRMDAGEA